MKWAPSSLEVDRVLAHRVVHGEKEYLVHHKGTDSSEDTWYKWSTYISPDVQAIIEYEKQVEQDQE